MTPTTPTLSLSFLGRYSKFITAIAGIALTILISKYANTPSAESWLPYLTGAFAALGVYAVPNAPKMLTVTGTVEHIPEIVPLTSYLSPPALAELKAAIEVALSQQAPQPIIPVSPPETKT